MPEESASEAERPTASASVSVLSVAITVGILVAALIFMYGCRVALMAAAKYQKNLLSKAISSGGRKGEGAQVTVAVASGDLSSVEPIRTSEAAKATVNWGLIIAVLFFTVMIVWTIINVMAKKEEDDNKN